MNRHVPTISICLLIWLVPFFAVIAPGHQRGVLKTPGSVGDPIAMSAPKCALCAFVAGWGKDEAPTGPVSPTNPAGDCAICHFNGTLLNPPPFELPNLRPVRLDLPADSALPARVCVVAHVDRLVPRGPPTIG